MSDSTGNTSVILLSREEAARLVRERGCKCRKARSTSISGTGRPRKEDYMCACPDQMKDKKKTKKQLKKKIVSTQAPVAKPAGKAPASGPKTPAIKESL
ncbi:hypothetical protein HPB50_018726 [Hyalomma asiaticum]|uniref:Uncharacterized protein n=1 Tax=Hyalomma asiaticum TaxID=266040 RepID=A0ACB7RXS1_HYAAI|nr:hypothetical protein HPB50_018726 [Hyalomma asiaticum]